MFTNITTKSKNVNLVDLNQVIKHIPEVEVKIGIPIGL